MAAQAPTSRRMRQRPGVRAASAHQLLLLIDLVWQSQLRYVFEPPAGVGGSACL